LMHFFSGSTRVGSKRTCPKAMATAIECESSLILL
jgi:hypothetical protein